MPPGCTPDDYDGVLVYVKPAVYGTIEPRDVVNYANLSPSFPQESSADQFFTESQFESYRALGFEIMDGVLSQTLSKKSNAENPSLGDAFFPANAAG